MAKQHTSARRRRATEWPDRDASRKRQRRRRWMLGLVAAIAVLPWFAFPWLRDAFRDWRGLPAADVAGAPAGSAPSVALPLPPQQPAGATVASPEDVASVDESDPAAGAYPGGDPPAAGMATDATADAAPPAPLPPLADADHPQERADARRAAMAVAGVRSAGWIARGQLLAVVDTASLRQPDVAGAICRAMAAHGDTEGVNVQLQHAAATTASGRAMLATPCRRMVPRPPAAIGAQPVGEDPAVVRARLRAEAEAEAAAQRGDATTGDAAATSATDPAREQRDASMRILEESTPEL